MVFTFGNHHFDVQIIDHLYPFINQLDRLFYIDT